MDIQTFISIIDGEDLLITMAFQGVKTFYAAKHTQVEYDEEKVYFDYTIGSMQIDLKVINKINIKDNNMIQIITEAGELWISGAGLGSLQIPVDKIKNE